MNAESINYLFEVGKKSKQEDYIWPVAGEATQNDKVFIVCDGAGIFNSGETASKLICQFMAAKVPKFSEQRMSGELIDRLLEEARDRLVTYARVHRLDTDLATTFSMLILYDQKVFLSWCGDSRIYHLRGGEILFSTEDHPHVGEPIQKNTIARGIKADSSPIYAETKWIEDLQDDDYFLLCSKGITENVTNEEIKSLLSQNDKAKMDTAGSLRRLVSEKASDNYSMYLIKLDAGVQKRGIHNGTYAIGKPSSGNRWPVTILAITIVALLIMVFYFRRARTPGPEPKYTNQTTQPVEVLREDTVPNALVISAPRKPIPAVTDSVKTKMESPQAAPQIDRSAAIQAEEPTKQTAIQAEEPTKQTPAVLKKRPPQLMIKLTTDESCKLKITNTDLNDVIDWDLSPNDNGTIYLKPGKYTILATSETNSSKTKTYNFDVSPGNTHNTQNIHIRF
jgi:PPM family protein phosphatase